MNIKEIIEGCRLGGISLEQRLATIEDSTIPAMRAEAALISAELARRGNERATHDHYHMSRGERQMYGYE